MRFSISTLVKQSYRKVFAGFTEDLFVKLNPPGIKFELLRYDGLKQGDVVHVRLSFLFFKQDWISVITEVEEKEGELYFIDKSEKLPFFLKDWEHHHRIVRADDNSSHIIDDIRYKTPFFLMDYLMYPIMYAQFAYRKPIYRKVFSNQD